MPRMAADHEASSGVHHHRRHKPHISPGDTGNSPTRAGCSGAPTTLLFSTANSIPAKVASRGPRTLPSDSGPAQKPEAPGTEDFTTQFNPTGQYSLIRFNGALPRAKLYSHWQVQTNDAVTLETLAKRDSTPPPR
ncbi:MAG: hypothetical protein Ct9H300mP7_1530 [Verrucomicrobiota bacterium]|nr:MAG: hypothetical protein Ct9H300mP7_1530 [Verrucomicrobiota bacterium]